MADFVLKNNLFEFNSKFYKQISGTSIETKIAPGCLYFYGSHWNAIFKDARHKTLVLEEIYWEDRKLGRLRKIPWELQ